MPQEVLLVDNVDSFTYNVADLLHRVLGRAPVVWRHDHPATPEDLRRFAAVVVGPGPGRPQVATDMGLSDLVLRQDDVPVLGVCLGHQGIAHVAGEAVVEMALPRHGVVSAVEHDGTGLFREVPSPLQVVRYHSLEVAEPLASGLRVTARAVDDGSVMALADPDRPFWGVQFHPESVLSEHGELIMANFLTLAGIEVPPGAGGPRGTDTGAVAVGDALAASAPCQGGRPVRLGVRRMAGPVDDLALRDALVADAPTSVWLDASDGTGWSVVVDARGPLSRELTHRVGEAPPLMDRMDEELGRWCLEATELARVRELDLPFPWRPGLVGYWGYELKAETGGSAAHRSPWPDAWLILADRGVVVDHRSGDVWALWWQDGRVDRAQEAWAETVQAAVRAAARGGAGAPHAGATARPTRTSPPSGAVDARETVDPASGPAGRRAVARDDQTAYLAKVRRALGEIARGESYEICLTTTYEAPDTGVGERDLYRAMREVSPVPRGAWLRTPAGSVLSGSPERFVSVLDGMVEARPIKGTRPRGETPEQDADLAGDLARSQKDRAENLMIVDLLRNDLHRVCRSGSVFVPEIFAVESYATVHQLVSTVRGRLSDGMGPTDVLRACFPGGSMTGAPKVRTMEILDELEGGPRGVYAGAIGWVGLDGSMDTSIVIRTATWRDGDVTLGWVAP
ncbi:chorismate-binding protein [Ornithinimicrobium flavum]|uniref:chorismate-binding protein n=1 Tax=Ornithinimicrobium flavum TaxID=1288636 RepID=UPI001930FF1B|nr:chorismate-binding protein [Ornithinimicrobium flavum]